MKNKLFISVVLIITLVTNLICGCKEKPKLKAYLIGGNPDGTIQESKMGEFELWSDEKMNKHIDPNAPKTFTLTFNGETYLGTYEYSQVVFMTNHRSDTYSFEGGQFEINPETQLLTFLRFSNTGTTEKTITSEQGKEIAEGLLKELVDTDEYKLEIEEFKTYYSYCYTKYLNKIKTSEKIVVNLALDGTLKRIRIQMQGYFSHPGRNNIYAGRDERLISDTATDLVKKKVEEFYPAVKEKKTEYNITDKWYVYDDGYNLCMLYKVEIDSVYDENGQPVSSGALDFVLIR